MDRSGIEATSRRAPRYVNNKRIKSTQLKFFSDLRNPTKKRNALLEQITKEEAEVETPEAMGIEIDDDYEEDINRAVLLLQSVSRGRATQMKV